MIRTLCVIALATLTSLGHAGTASAFSDGRRHGCGVLVDAAHPWSSRVPDATVETGDHWVTDRLGTHGSCTFTHASIKKLLALPPRTYQHRDTARLAGGVCDWSVGSGHETIKPFQRITCHLPIHLRNHRTYLATVEAYVDPDPRFIQ
jgi:hypothetical protein